MPRPAVEVDLAEVEKLGALQCTYEEVAAWFKVEKRTVVRWMKKPDIAEAFERGKASGRTSLRRAQFQAALRGNPALLIWLGKTILGQVDKLETQSSFTVEDNRAEAYRKLTVDELRTINEIMERAESERPSVN